MAEEEKITCSGGRIRKRRIRRKIKKTEGK